MKGETVDEIVGAARAMRARMVGVDFAADPIIDTCGTGGDGSRSVNVSTIAAFLVAGGGVVVAKHGNRAQSSQAGSHDVLEALGLDAAPKPDVAARCLREAKLAFLFAPAHHGATKHVGLPRKELGVRTIFNLLGPLTNPCGAKFHVNGIFSRERCEILAQAHGVLGSKRAMVVHGAGGLDEFAPAGRTFVAELADGGVKTHELTPADFGLPESDPIGLRGGLPADNAHRPRGPPGRRPRGGAQRDADDRRRGALRRRRGAHPAGGHGEGRRSAERRERDGGAGDAAPDRAAPGVRINPGNPRRVPGPSREGLR